jgi:hypothetical protein
MREAIEVRAGMWSAELERFINALGTIADIAPCWGCSALCSA